MEQNWFVENFLDYRELTHSSDFGICVRLMEAGFDRELLLEAAMVQLGRVSPSDPSEGNRTALLSPVLSCERIWVNGYPCGWMCP